MEASNSTNGKVLEGVSEGEIEESPLSMIIIVSFAACER